MNVKKYVMVSSILFIMCYIVFSKPHDIKFEKEVYNFGEVEPGQDVNYTFVFKNTGTEPLIIEEVQPTCGCTIAADWDKEVMPNKRGKIPLTFKSYNFKGDVVKVINVKTNVPDRPSIQLTLEGKIIIPIEVVSNNQWLGEVVPETKVLIGTFEIISYLNKPLKIKKIIPPGNNIKYNIQTIEKDKRYQVNYTIKPPFDGQDNMTKTFTIMTNDKNHKTLNFTFYYSVSPKAQIANGK